MLYPLRPSGMISLELVPFCNWKTRCTRALALIIKCNYDNVGHIPKIALCP